MHAQRQQGRVALTTGTEVYDGGLSMLIAEGGEKKMSKMEFASIKLCMTPQHLGSQFLPV